MDTQYCLVRNAMRTPDGTIIRSRHRHDYVTHKDANGSEYMLDGGLVMFALVLMVMKKCW